MIILLDLPDVQFRRYPQYYKPFIVDIKDFPICCSCKYPALNKESICKSCMDKLLQVGRKNNE